MTRVSKVRCIAFIVLALTLQNSPRLVALAAPEGAAPQDDGGPVIEPGKEEILGAMLGKDGTLGGNCTLQDGQVERIYINSTYKCDNGDAILRIEHPSRASKPTATTQKFAITVLSGSPPAGLVEEVASRIRAREGEFAWKIVEQPNKAGGGSPLAPLTLVALAVTAVLAIVLLLRRTRQTRSET